MRFKTQAEIYQALLDRKKIIYKEGEIVGLVDGVVRNFFRDGTSAIAKWGFYHPEEWSIYEEPKPKKKVMLYRYTLENTKYGTAHQTAWESAPFDGNSFVKILKTESKEVEADDV